MKKYLALILALVLALSLFAGCTAKEETTTTTTTTTSDTEGEEPASTDGEITGTLEVAVFSNGDAMDNFWNTAVEEFNKLYPDCEVTLIANPKIEDSIRPRFVSGNPPDVYYMGGTANVDEASLTADGQFMKLNDWYETAEAIGYDGLLKDNMSAEVFNRVGDDIYGMAFAYSVWGYYYNVGMAEEYGWEPPTNWEEFCELAPKIKAEGLYPMIHQGKYPDYIGYGLMQPGIATDNGKETLVEMGNLNADTYRSDAVRSAYEKLEVIRDNEWVPTYALSLTHTEAQMEWLQGKAFLIPCGNWLEGEMANDIPEGFEMGFMPTFWYDSENAPVYVASGGRISISAKAQNPEAAKAFLEVIYSKTMTQAIVENSMGIPCVKDTLEGVEMVPSCKEPLEQAAAGEVVIINEVGGSGNFEPYAEQRTATTNAISSILGGQSADEALETLATEIERIASDDAIAKVAIS